MAYRFLGIFLLTLAGALSAAEVLVIEQEYNLVRSGKEGVEAKDVRQKLYLTRSVLRIDQFDGEGQEPTTSVLVDLERRVITELDRSARTKLEETFDQRSARIESRKKKVQEDIDALEGVQKEKTVRLYRAMLDDSRSFQLAQRETPARQIAGVECRQVRVVDRNDPTYEPLTLYLNPRQELPYDSAEVLYLLQIIGGKMRDFLGQHRAQFRNVPMEMSIDLAVGGMLRARVVHVEETTLEKLGTAFFAIPANYREKAQQSRQEKRREVDPTQ